MRNKRNIVVIFTIMTLLMVAAYFVNEAAVQGSSVNIINDVRLGEAKLVVSIEPGAEWTHYIYHIIKASPQYAIWMEDTEGSFLGTLYVTQKTFDWAKKSAGQKPERVEALPYWWHKQKLVQLTDAMTSATPQNDIHIYNMISDYPARVVVKLEINNSLDFNEHYTKNGKNGTEYSGASGQPALIYAAEVDLANPGEYDLRLIGHSSPDGSDGRLYLDMSYVTTAMRIIKSTTVQLK